MNSKPKFSLNLDFGPKITDIVKKIAPPLCLEAEKKFIVNKDLFVNPLVKELNTKTVNITMEVKKDQSPLIVPNPLCSTTAIKS